MDKQKPLLITGIHNSGSTWIGKILADSRQLQYIHEPFNLKQYPNSPLIYWYQYIHEKSSNQNEVKDYVLKFHHFNFLRFISKSIKAKYLGKIKQALEYES